MKRTILSFFTFVPSLLFGSTEVDVPTLLSAIAQVEGDSTTKVGAAGERSRWQITSTVWYSHSTFSFTKTASATDAISLAEQQFVAEQHVKWLQAKLPRPTVYRLAMAWNAGRGAVMEKRVTAATKDYAQRVKNLYDEAIRQQEAD